jgi:hypothetical protein
MVAGSVANTEPEGGGQVSEVATGSVVKPQDFFMHRSICHKLICDAALESHTLVEAVGTWTLSLECSCVCLEISTSPPTFQCQAAFKPL